ncbi:MAG: hypothetical protein Q9159_001643 [Coniocarpon cinnabarinum]
MAKYDINETWADALSLALQFEQSNWATGSVRGDPFYTAPSNSSGASPGTLLSVQEFTNLSTYTVAPQVALSKFLYQTEDFNGSAIPASAFVLWPYMARTFDLTGEKLPVVAWAHGTNGWSPECAPSHFRQLSYQYASIFELALEGYVVVAPDYAGLGVGADAKGNSIPYQYMAHPAAANDVAFAVEAARQAWPELSEQFVVMGHSLGGGTAWSFAQRQVQRPVEGYLGTVAVSPVAGLLDEAVYQPNPLSRIATTAQGVGSIIPGFELTDWLTTRGIQDVQLILEIEGCNSLASELFVSKNLVKDGWNATESAQAFQKLTSNGGKLIAGPMVVLQGTEDTNVPVALTDSNVAKTCPAQLEYYIFEGTQHVPTLYASKQIWVEWITSRFSGDAAAEGCTKNAVQPARPVEQYSQGYSWFIEYAQYPYLRSG